MVYDPYAWIDPFEEIANAYRRGSRDGFDQGTQAVRNHAEDMVKEIVEKRLKPLEDYPSAVPRLLAGLRYERVMSAERLDGPIEVRVGLMEPFRYHIRMALPLAGRRYG